MLWEAFGSMALACMAAGFITGLLYEKWHREREQFDAEIAAHETRIERNRAAGRHAKSQPRALPSPAPAAVPAERSRTSLVRSGYRDSWRLPLEGGAPVTAASIPPVFLPPQPAPDLNGADDTGTMPRVRLARGDTGEMRAVTSAWIAENCPGAEEAIA